MKLFKDRQSAGKLLADRLKNTKAGLVLGIPRGGVVVAAEIAKVLHLPLDIIVTRKIGAPNQPELALGAVDADGEAIWEEQLLRDLQLKIEDLRNEINKAQEEIRRREKTYRQERGPLKVENKTIILTDDGIATGSTTLAAINFLKKHQAKKIILAVPVASIDSVKKIKPRVSKIVVLETPQDFQAVGQFYYQFDPVTDEEVVQLLHHER